MNIQCSLDVAPVPSKAARLKRSKYRCKTTQFVGRFDFKGDADSSKFYDVLFTAPAVGNPSA
eukprot:scaffold1690_cov182-Amphora_coffeaeformis.AAC.25